MVCAAVLLGAVAPVADAAVLVRFEAGTDATDRAAARREAGVRREQGLGVRGLEVVSGGAAAAAALQSAPGVRYAREQHYGAQRRLFIRNHRCDDRPLAMTQHAEAVRSNLRPRTEVRERGSHVLGEVGAGRTFEGAA